MKRNLSQSRRPPLKSLAIALLAASLVAGPGLAGVASAVEPAPTPIASSPGAGTPQPAAPAPAAPSPEEAAVPAETQAAQPSEEATQSMAEAVGVGGAEMGQRSARVTASAPSDSVKRLSTESLSTEGTWMPTFGVQGLDVSGHQTSVDWRQQWNMGARFAYVKASEGNYYTNERFSSQYQGSRSIGMLRGAYHFAIPNWSSGADQARYFVQNGGGWSADGYTMPPVLDFEFNPYEGRTINGFYFGNTCYNMSPAQLQSWVRDFGNTMRSLTGRLPVIYTNTSWWNSCLGNPAGFGDYPLWVAAYPKSATNDAGPVPTGSWSTYSIWQYSSTGPLAGDSNVWNGTLAQLQTFARGTVGSNGAIDAKWRATGGATGPLGAARSTADVCGLVNNGCYRAYANGNIYWTAATGAHPVTGSYWTAWGEAGWQKGIGYPTSDATCPTTTSTCHQTFQGGNAYNTPGLGTFVVKSSYMSAWKAAGWQDGIGYPKSVETCGLYGGGCHQEFTKGNIYWSATTGAHAVTGAYWTAWQKAGFQPGIGYPTGPVTCGLYGNGCYQPFAKGNIYWTATTGAHAVTEPYRDAWRAQGWQAGRLGYPTSAAVAAAGYGTATFEGGSLTWTASGVAVSYS
jgi:GH25 family lysozyme M1 (1,4-beta-N-acetylmuramidase)